VSKQKGSAEAQAKEDGLVAADVAALELRRLRGALDAAAREVAALQQRKAELQDTVLTQQRTLQVPTLCLVSSCLRLQAASHRWSLGVRCMPSSADMCPGPAWLAISLLEALRTLSFAQQ